MSKTNPGNFFEDFSVGQAIVHATPRTVTEGDVSLYTALTGSRFAVPSSDVYAMALGFEAAPVDDLLVFHMVFGKSVPDVSLNAVANLGYASAKFGSPVYPGDTLSATSQVIGVKENSNRRTGVVYIHTTGINQNGEMVLDFVRWVMVNKRDQDSPAPETVIPSLDDSVGTHELGVPAALDLSDYDTAVSGSPHLWDDFEVGERIDHVDGMTIEEAEHIMAAKLYQNTAKVHLNHHSEKDGRFGRRLMYGGHVMSVARALTFNGLGNAFKIAAINGGKHVGPMFAGDTVYAWTEVLGTMSVPDRDDLGALRLRTVAAKDNPCGGYPGINPGGGYDPSVVLDLDYTVLMPKRG